MLNRQRPFRIHSDAVSSFCLGVLQEIGAPPGIVSVVFVGPRKMRQLNRRFRGRDYATDVLSFSYDEGSMDGAPFLGEIVVAPRIAWENAGRFDQEPAEELRRLLVHGLLHLLGHDHESDEGEMNRMQRRLLRSRALAARPPLAEVRRKA